MVHGLVVGKQTKQPWCPFRSVPVTWRAARSRGSPWPTRSRPQQRWGAPCRSCPSASPGSRCRWASGTRTAPGTPRHLAGCPPCPVVVAESTRCELKLKIWPMGWDEITAFWNARSSWFYLENRVAEPDPPELFLFWVLHYVGNNLEQYLVRSCDSSRVILQVMWQRNTFNGSWRPSNTGISRIFVFV